MADGDAPDIQGTPQGIDLGSGNALMQSAQEAERQQTANQPPKMGLQPNVMQLISALAGPKGTVQPGQAQPSRPPSRLDAFEHFVGNFLNAFSQGMANSGQGPAANARGFGAAVQAPYRTALQQFQTGQQAQAQQAQIQSEQARAGLERAQAQQMANVVQTPYGPMSSALAAKVFPAAIGAQGRVAAAQINQGQLANVPQELQDKYGVPAQLPINKVKALMAAEGGQYQLVQGANDQFLVSKIDQNKTALGVGNPRTAATLMRPVQVADPNNPGGTKWVTAGDAVKFGMAGPQSASVTVPKAVMAWAATGKGGEEINAFNTALQHADLLEKAVVAMHNGDQKTLNSLKNSFKTQFGSADVTNFQVIANAYTREVTKMLSSGHMTDNEIKDQGATLPANASDEQIYGAIQAYRALANSKMQMRYNQYQQGLKGQPNFPANVTGGGNTGSALDRLSKKYLTAK